MFKMKLADDETFVEGRSKENAKRLVQKASELGVDPRLVRATTGGYIAPKVLAGDVKSPSGHFSAVEENTNQDLPHPDSKENEQRKEQAKPKGESFDPADYGVGAVKRYLEGASEDERQRVLDAEREGKARKSLLLDNEREED